MSDVTSSPAQRAADEAQARVYACIDKGKRFLVEAGAGAGKTESLIKALRYIIDKHGAELLRRRQRVACITYTNVATEEIRSRTDGHPVIQSSTIHAFCWSLIKDFQPQLRERLPALHKWPERLAEAGEIGTRQILYELGYPRAKRDEPNILLGHNDVLSLTVLLMKEAKFRNIFTTSYPVLLIDEYQDTNEEFASALKEHFLDKGEGPLIGFFGDNWQKIYGDGCGKIEHAALEVIGKKANFRSVPVIVEVLNKMRPDLPQEVEDPNAEGSMAVYHTNEWIGTRRTEAHWKGDLPAEAAHEYLHTVETRLAVEHWEFSPQKTKILMLTHNILANEQGYSRILEAFEGNNDRVIRKEDNHIKFLVETLEPVCTAYENKRFGEMFAALDRRTPAIQSYADKTAWAESMNALLKLRFSGTIGAVLDHLKQTKRPRLPDTVEQKERQLEQSAKDLDPDEQSSIDRLRSLRDVPYREVIALGQFIDDKTPFSTKHGVKGAEFENVLVVFGRGWNHYDFNQMLEWAGTVIPRGKEDTFERNRNLFYVCCSRPKKRLALLFTQKLSDRAMSTLANWFGVRAIHSLGSNPSSS
jgi:DNA helicase-2/ATP-dependent DNA helicase PcrA